MLDPRQPCSKCFQCPRMNCGIDGRHGELLYLPHIGSPATRHTYTATPVAVPTRWLSVTGTKPFASQSTRPQPQENSATSLAHKIANKTPHTSRQRRFS